MSSVAPKAGGAAPAPAAAGAPASPLDEIVSACRRALVGIGGFSFVINLLMLTVPIYMIQVFDRVMTSRSQDTLWLLSVAALAAFALMGLVELVRSRLLVRMGVWMDRRLTPPLLSAALGGAAGGAGAGQVLRDLAQVRGFVTGPGVFPLLDAPWFPLFIAFIFLMHPVLGAIAVAGAALLLMLAVVNDRATRGPLASANTAQAETMAILDVMTRQRDAIAALGMASALTTASSAAGWRVVTAQALASDRAGACLALSRFFRLGLQIVILAVAAMFVIHDQLTAGAMMATSIMFGRALAPVEQAVGVWRQFIDARLAFGRLRAALATGETGAPTAAMALPRPTGALSIERASCSAPGAREPLFQTLSLTLAAGEMLGVIGPSGAGKSTLARLLVGLAAPQSGCIRLDGVDVHAWSSADLGRHIGYVPQCVELVPGTVAANIARFTDAAPAEVVAAARAAGIHELVLQLPHGYDTIIGGPFDLLSAGTRQRLALARALFGDPAFLVLDEPYSNLDAAGLKALMAALQGARARKVTTVIIAHRPSVLAAADTVLLIEGGKAKVIDRETRAKLSVVGAKRQPRIAERPSRPCSSGPASAGSGKAPLTPAAGVAE